VVTGRGSPTTKQKGLPCPEGCVAWDPLNQEAFAMDNNENRHLDSSGSSSLRYMDIRAEIGISEHLGGRPFTDILYRLCHLAEAREVLEVGCGVGIGSVYMARRFACHVVAVDLSEKMLSWARQCARREGLVERIEFHQADVCQLPFQDDRFDATIVESVLAFVTDKPTAIRELIRVTKPGGYIGLNEVFWLETPPPEFIAHAARVWGSEVLTVADWRKLWESTPLEEPTIQVRRMDPGRDFAERARWIGWRAVLPALGRVARLWLTDSRARDSIRQQFNVPAGMARSMGYGLFVGRKPQ